MRVSLLDGIEVLDRKAQYKQKGSTALRKPFDFTGAPERFEFRL